MTYEEKRAAFEADILAFVRGLWSKDELRPTERKMQGAANEIVKKFWRIVANNPDWKPHYHEPTNKLV